MLGVKTALITGYSYYGKYWFNPSGEVAKLLDGSEISVYRVKSLVLPASFNSARSTLQKVLEELKPDFVLGLGLAPLARMLEVELVAVNYVYFTQPDVNGVKAELEKIDPRGPPVVYTTLPVEAVVKKCKSQRGYPIKPSLSTGLYLCNVAAYMIMRYGLERRVPAGFVHIPPSTVNMLRRESEFGTPLEEIADTVKCIVEASTGVAFED
ncbi:MAG: hypothetical protein QXU03_04220 [Desulfurococcaceae archaeon]